MLAAELHEALYGPLDEGIGDAIAKAFDKWQAKNVDRRARMDKKARAAASKRFLNDHPQLILRAKKAKDALGGWDRFKTQYSEIFDSMGSIGMDVANALGTI